MGAPTSVNLHTLCLRAGVVTTSRQGSFVVSGRGGGDVAMEQHSAVVSLDLFETKFRCTLIEEVRSLITVAHSAFKTL